MRDIDLFIAFIYFHLKPSDSIRQMW